MIEKAPLFLTALPGYAEVMLAYHVAFYLPLGNERMVVTSVLDFPGVMSQGFDLTDARAMIASALEDIAQLWIEEGRALPIPEPHAHDPEADLVEILPLSVEVGAARR